MQTENSDLFGRNMANSGVEQCSNRGEDYPIVDFSVYSLDNKHVPSDDELAETVMEIRTALEQKGFFYVTNTGISETLIDEVWEKAEDMFKLPVDQQRKYKMVDPIVMAGGTPPDRHDCEDEARTGRKKDTDKERVRYNPLGAARVACREEDCPGYERTLYQYWDTGSRVGLRILECISMAMGQDRRFIVDNFYTGLQKKSPDSNGTVAKLNYFRAKNTDEEVLRVIPHQDFGVMNIIHTNCTGLQFELSEGKWTDAPLIPGALLVLGGMILEIWSSHQLKAVPHQSVSRGALSGSKETRRVAIIFMDPDVNSELQPLNPESGVDPITYVDHFIKHNYK